MKEVQEEIKGELIVKEKLNAVEVFTGPQGVEKILADIEAKVAAFTPDTSTAKGRALIASMSYKVSQSKTLLDSLGKDLVSDWKQKSALVDASRKIARDRLDALRDKTRQPLTEWEESEEKRIAAEKLAKAIDDDYAAALVENDLFDRARAVMAKEAAIARIEAERLEREAAELAAKEAKEAAERAEAERIANEERIRQEAAANAQKEVAEKAERDRVAAEEKAKADQAAAVAAAEEKARQDAARIEAARKAVEAEAAAKVEAERKEAERKAADVEHRRTVNKEAMAGLVSAGVSEDQAKAVITAIIGGLVAHISIKY